MKPTILTFMITILANTYVNAQTPIDPDQYHDKQTGEYKLHHKLIDHGERVYYWHAPIIKAGYEASLDDPNGQAGSSVTETECSSDNRTRTIQDGFIIDDDRYCTACGNSGAAIFRADDKIILSSGFKVLYNPHSVANDTLASPSINFKDAAYFHAYTGDRFSCAVWDTDNSKSTVINDDYTNLTALSNKWDKRDHCPNDNNSSYHFKPNRVTPNFTYSSPDIALRLDAEDVGTCKSIDPNTKYETGEIQSISSFGFQYGKFEVESKLPSEKGSFPAIWTYHKGLPGEFHQDELDLLECNSPWYDFVWCGPYLNL